MGHRKPYILLGLVMAGAAFAAAGFVPPDANLWLFSALVVLGSFSVTVFDSTTDGLAIDVTPADQQGKVQGVMVAGRAGAFILLSLVFGSVVQSLGYRPIFLTIGVAMLLPLLWVVFLREPASRAASQSFDRRAFRELGKPRFLLFAAYAVIYSVGSFGVDGLVTYFLSERFSAAETVIGRYGAMRGLGAVVGALIGALLLDRVSRRRSAMGSTLLISVGALLIALAPTARAVVGLGLVWGIVWAVQETVFFALAMRIADARIAASMFAIMMGISNLGSAVADGGATALSDNLGFRTVFLVLAGFNLVTLVVLSRLFRAAPEIGGAGEESAVR